MMSARKCLMLCILVFGGLVLVKAQPRYMPLGRQVQQQVDPYLNQLGSDFHTAIRPYRLDEVKKMVDPDTTYYNVKLGSQGDHRWLPRKVFHENLLLFQKEDLGFYGDVLFDLELGNDLQHKAPTYLNTRGFRLGGNISNNFAFETRFYESQAKFPEYLQTYVFDTLVIPGQGRRRQFKKTGHDYGYAAGYISYSPSKYFNLQFGHDKVFLGDGYRSLLLSDASFNYPFLKVETKVWKLKYVNLFSQYQDIQAKLSQNNGFPKKFSTIHYLSINVGKRWNFGLFESIVWQNQDSTGFRGFDINYLNPVIFYRPIEFSLGSPDNALLGASVKFKINGNNFLYGQVLLDEMKFDEFKAMTGWYGNKQAAQFGTRHFNVLGIKRLSVQNEFNYVRPYTYSHRSISPIQNYAHYQQPLAHPMGANFWEAINIINFNIKRIYIDNRVSYAIFGQDTAGLNFGKNINLPYDIHPHDYGNKVGQGLTTSLIYHDFSIGYLINPASNMRLQLGVVNRVLSSDLGSDVTTFVSIGLRTHLRNFYYDYQ